MLVVAGDRLARAGLAATLQAEGIAVVGRLDPADIARDDDDVLEALDADVIVADLGGPGGGVDATAARMVALLEALLDGGVEIGGDGSIERAAEDDDDPVLVALVDDAGQADLARSLGATAILDREISGAALAAALVAARAGLLVASPSVADTMAGFVRASDYDGPLDPLTPREAEVLTHLADGRSNRQIAAALSISPHTVKDHVDAILSKLGASSRTEAVVRAARSGVISL